MKQKKSRLKTTWDLTLMYAHDQDPRIEDDMVHIEEACQSFSEKWQSRIHEFRSTQVLLESLHDYQHLQHIIGDVQPVAYFMLARDIYGQREHYPGIISQLQERVTRATNLILFYELALGQLPDTVRHKISRNRAYDSYDYFLQRIWNQAAHRLSPEAEQILALKSEPAYTRWVDGSEKLIAQQTILWKGKELPLHEALGRMGALPSSKERQRMHALILKKMKAISYFIEHEINAIVTDKKINDQLRHFEHPFSATILDYENDETMVVGLMDTLNRHQKISHKLSQIKQKLMGGDKLSYADMGVTLAASKQTFSFERGVALVRRAFAKVHPVYVEIFDRFLEQGQIDVYPRTGKRGGGYCWGGYGRPTYVLLNWTDDLRSVTTLAHEMGHAIHRELSKSQSVLYEHHPISTSEVASTLFENFVFEEILEELPEKDRLYARFNRLQDAVATILRQSAYFEFEKELHLRIRERGYLGHESIARIMYQQLKKHLGPAYVLKPEDGYLFVRYMHARWFFYVYSYAYGHLMSTTLFTHLQQDPQAIEKINEFLSSGGRFSPEEIFKKIGYDTSRPEFWEEGLRALEQEIQLLKRDARKLHYY